MNRFTGVVGVARMQAPAVNRRSSRMAPHGRTFKPARASHPELRRKMWKRIQNDEGQHVPGCANANVSANAPPKDLPTMIARPAATRLCPRPVEVRDEGLHGLRIVSERVGCDPGIALSRGTCR
jgi:hypothetical protein